MSEKGSRKRTFLQKLSDRVKITLTGEKPNHRRKRKYSETPLTSGPGDKTSLIFPKPEVHSKRKKPGRRGVLKKLFKPGRKQGKQHAEKIFPDQAVNKSSQESVFSTDTGGVAASYELKPRPQIQVKTTRPALRKKKSLFKKLFGTKKKKEQPSPKAISGNRKELKNAMISESYALLNSMGLYILAYLTVYNIYQFTGALVASNFNIDSVLFYYEIYFPVGNSSPLWNRFNIIVITMASPVISLLISIILLRAALMREKLNPQFRLFLLWVAFHGATHFLGAFVAGIATSQGFGYVVDWLYLNVFFRILISLIFLFLLTITGYNSAVFALETIPTGIRQQRWRLSLSLIARFILPWIIGGLMVIAVKFPDSAPQHPNIMIYDAIIIATMGFMVIPVFFNSKARPRSLAERPVKSKRPPGILIFTIAVATLFLFRFVFERGIHLVINFSFDVGFYR